MSAAPNVKRILFLSGVDFKEKSIQVIRKTPEAYHQAGWEVHYVVGRDNSVNGDYFYESIVNPEGLIIYRFFVPLSKAHGLINNAMWKAIWFRIRNILMILTLAWKGIKLIRKNRFDVVYGYEIPGVLAARLIRFFGYLNNTKLVIRFQGVLYVKEWLRRKQKFRLLSNIDAIIALRTRADLCIMTNDGSQGLNVLQQLNSPTPNVLFCPNGVDKIQVDDILLKKIQHDLYTTNTRLWHFMSVSRLDNHKRIDRGIRIINEMIHTYGFRDVTYTVIGGGTEYESLLALTRRLSLEDYVRFLGPVKHEMVKYHFYLADVFISMYTSTNVGNPLLEAIRYNKLIVTLENGDTGDWIKHLESGLIYPVNDDTDLAPEDYKRMAADIIRVLQNKPLYDNIKLRLKDVEASKLWTWEERLHKELSEVNQLLN